MTFSQVNSADRKQNVETKVRSTIMLMPCWVKRKTVQALKTFLHFIQCIVLDTD